MYNLNTCVETKVHSSRVLLASIERQLITLTLPREVMTAKQSPSSTSTEKIELVSSLAAEVTDIAIDVLEVIRQKKMIGIVNWCHNYRQ